MKKRDIVLTALGGALSTLHEVPRNSVPILLYLGPPTLRERFAFTESYFGPTSTDIQDQLDSLLWSELIAEDLYSPDAGHNRIKLCRLTAAGMRRLQELSDHNPREFGDIDRAMQSIACAIGVPFAPNLIAASAKAMSVRLRDGENLGPSQRQSLCEQFLLRSDTDLQRMDALLAAQGVAEPVAV